MSGYHLTTCFTCFTTYASIFSRFFMEKSITWLFHIPWLIVWSSNGIISTSISVSLIFCSLQLLRTLVPELQVSPNTAITTCLAPPASYMRAYFNLMEPVLKSSASRVLRCFLICDPAKASQEELKSALLQLFQKTLKQKEFTQDHFTRAALLWYQNQIRIQ